jgi:hypothetical protein
VQAPRSRKQPASRIAVPASGRQTRSNARATSSKPVLAAPEPGPNTSVDADEDDPPILDPIPVPQRKKAAERQPDETVHTAEKRGGKHSSHPASRGQEPSPPGNRRRMLRDKLPKQGIQRETHEDCSSRSQSPAPNPNEQTRGHTIATKSNSKARQLLENEGQAGEQQITGKGHGEVRKARQKVHSREMAPPPGSRSPSPCPPLDRSPPPQKRRQRSSAPSPEISPTALKHVDHACRTGSKAAPWESRDARGKEAKTGLVQSTRKHTTSTRMEQPAHRQASHPERLTGHARVEKSGKEVSKRETSVQHAVQSRGAVPRGPDPANDPPAQEKPLARPSNLKHEQHNGVAAGTADKLTKHSGKNSIGRAKAPKKRQQALQSRKANNRHQHHQSPSPVAKHQGYLKRKAAEEWEALDKEELRVEASSPDSGFKGMLRKLEAGLASNSQGLPAI